jgi:hypothetical protein
MQVQAVHADDVGKRADWTHTAAADPADKPFAAAAHAHDEAGGRHGAATATGPVLESSVKQQSKSRAREDSKAATRKFRALHRQAFILT